MQKKEIEKLIEENKILKRKVEIAQKWIQRIVKEETKKISKRKINKMSSWVRESFMHENIEEIISNKINTFLWEFILLNTPASVIENIISAEINYYNFKKNPNFDWFSIISWYHKAIDIIIEAIITKWFRKFAKKQNQTILRQNDPLEKTLNSVVNKWFILSIWRLYHILNNIKTEEKLYDYGKTFEKYLDKYYYLKEILLDDNFLDIFKKLIVSEILWKKRHIWSINIEETAKARELLIWNFKNKESLIYILLKTQETNY